MPGRKKGSAGAASPAPGCSEPKRGTQGEARVERHPKDPSTSVFFLGYHCRSVIWVVIFFFFLMFTALIKNILQGSALKREPKATLQGVAGPTHSTPFSFKRPYQVEHN